MPGCCCGAHLTIKQQLTRSFVALTVLSTLSVRSLARLHPLGGCARLPAAAFGGVALLTHSHGVHPQVLCLGIIAVITLGNTARETVEAGLVNQMKENSLTIAKECERSACYI